MLIKIPSPERTVNLFTAETCHTLKNMDSDERKKKLSGLITSFFQNKIPDVAPAIMIAQESGVDQEIVSKVMQLMAQKGMTGPSDASNLMNRNQPVTAGVYYTSVVDDLDGFGYEEIYDFVDMRTAGQESFDILDVSNAITFTERKSGAKVKVYGITDGKSTVTLMEIAAAIGILDRWIDYAQFWNLNQAVIEARSKYYDKMSIDHYALLAAISSDQNEAYDTSIITTINNACAQIYSDCKDKGFTLTGNERFVLRARIELKEKVEQAFALTFNSPNTDRGQIVYPIDRAYTANTQIETTKIYVGLPGRKAKRGIWKDLSSESDRDILRGGTDVAYVGQYNAAIGEEDQFRRCSIS